ncbi:MAG: hypothetical protein ABIE70_01240 [bacterium]
MNWIMEPFEGPQELFGACPKNCWWKWDCDLCLFYCAGKESSTCT